MPTTSPMNFPNQHPADSKKPELVRLVFDGGVQFDTGRLVIETNE